MRRTDEATWTEEDVEEDSGRLEKNMEELDKKP